MSDDLAFLDATAQAELVRTGEASPLELVEAAIGRIEAVNPAINAVIHERFDKARQEAAGDLPGGPFRGVPFLLKDHDGCSAGDPCHHGNKLLKQLGHVAERDTFLTQKFREAGLVILGRTNTPEYGLAVTTEPEAYGACRNPWDTDRSTGGSSGGSAAAVAAGMVPMAHAGDGGGSIRIPSSECGLVGLKPSRGRHSMGPDQGESWGGLVIRMALTHSVRDCASMLEAISDPMPGDPYVAPTRIRPYTDEVGADPGRLRIGWTLTGADANVVAQPDTVAAVEKTASLLESLGHEVTESRPAPWENHGAPEEAELVGHFLVAYGVWTAADLDELATIAGRPVTEDDVEASTWMAAQSGREVTATQYLEAIEAFHAFGRRMAAWWDSGFDLLLTPTIPEPPPLLGEFGGPGQDPTIPLMRSAAVVPFCSSFNMTGQPAVSLPLHWSDEGLPIGVQFVAEFGREDVLLRLASQLEQAAPWADRKPPIHA